MLDLTHCDPRMVARSFTPAAVFEALKVQGVTPRVAEVLDYVHRIRTLDALYPPFNEDELAEFIEYFDRLLVQYGEAFDRLPDRYASQWNGLANLLDTQLDIVLRGKASRVSMTLS